MTRKLFPAILGCFLSQSAMALGTGEKVPDISAKNQNGKLVKLADLKGKFVLVYFYPKDDTPGCTKEAKNFQASKSDFKASNAVVLGVSGQDEASHQKFASKYGLDFDLLVDTDGKLRDTFGVGSIPVLGFSKRQSILIGPDGKVVKFYSDVDPEKHAAEVLNDIKSTVGQK